MTRRTMEIGLALALIAMLPGDVSAQPPASCTTAIIGLAPCLGYISGNSSTPSASCCSQLASVVQNHSRCLCTVVNGGASSFGITINQTQALTLPSVCKVKTPPVSQCNVAAAGPAEAPLAPSSSAPDKPMTPSLPIRAKTVPSRARSQFSNGSSNKSSSSLISAVSFVAACVTVLASICI